MYLNENDIMYDCQFQRLTLTWDVFKLLSFLIFNMTYLWLTLTWDVFK